jgi:hypothetical protein
MIVLIMLRTISIRWSIEIFTHVRVSHFGKEFQLQAVAKK